MGKDTYLLTTYYSAHMNTYSPLEGDKYKLCFDHIKNTKSFYLSNNSNNSIILKRPKVKNFEEEKHTGM